MFKNFNLEVLKKMNIQEVGSYAVTRVRNIKEEFRDDFDIDEQMLEDDEIISVPMDCIFDCLIDMNDYECDDFDDIQFRDFVEDLIKKAEHYLVVFHKITWNNKSGYKIVDNLIDCFYRDYDCSQYVIGGSRGQKVLSIKESHHDKPMGAEVVIIALTNKEYEKIENQKIDNIFDFAKIMENRIKYV